MPTSDNAGRLPARTKQQESRSDKAVSAATQAELQVRPRREWWWVSVLCALAAVRIFLGAAALPFFADTDELAHFDLVHKFARVNWPAERLVPLDRETIELQIFDGSPEFIAKPEEYVLGRIPPRYATRQIPPPVRDWPSEQDKMQVVGQLRDGLRKGPNHEAHSPPVYYALAGAWYKFGSSLGLTGPRCVYWVRFLNVPLYAALVASAYAFCRPYVGRETALAVAALTAFFPNTVFFTINSDILSPLLAVLALLLLLRWYERDQVGPGLAVGAGAMVAAAVLVKLTNAALLVAVAVVILLRLLRDRLPTRVLRESWPLLLSAVLPVFLWGVRNHRQLGDWSATASKLEQLTWKPKPPGELLNHPLFTTGGLTAYLTRLTTSLFDGDANWHKVAARSAVADAFFITTSAFLPVIGLGAAIRRKPGEPRVRLVVGVSALVVAAYLGVLTMLSLRFDFGVCEYPSRAFPFFTSGRLVAGALVPFLVLGAYGMEVLLARWPALFVGAVATTVAMMALSQLTFLRLAMVSQYNWFHLP